MTDRLPDPLSTIHLMGVGGTAMGALAGLLVDAGYAVTGSDAGVYPPMSDYLAELGIEVMEGYRAANLAHRPDLVVVGNVIRAAYEEARALLDSDLPYCSMPALLGAMFLRDTRNLVIAGTHGKTTTTAITAWMLDQLGEDPGFLVGGRVLGWPRTARAGGGRWFVLEGDEYDTAFFDKRPKFVHYRPEVAVLTSVEFDHADIYRDLDAVRRAFHMLVERLPPHGLLVARTDDPVVREVAAAAACPVEGYGTDQRWDGRIDEVDTAAGTMAFTVLREGRPWGRFRSRLVGRHNLGNQVAALATLAHLGFGPERLAPALESFRGIRRRQEIRGTVAGIDVVDDFAHHPTAVAATIDALRTRFGRRRLWVLFEPRSATSRRAVFQQAYAEAFDGADRVLVAPPYGSEEGPRLDPARLAADLRARGIDAIHLPGVEPIAATVAAEALEGDVVAVFSNGAFGGIHQAILDRLADRFGHQEGS